MQIPTTRENLLRYAATFQTVKFKIALRADPMHPYVYLEMPIETKVDVFRKTAAKLLGIDPNRICIYGQEGDEVACIGTVQDLHERYGGDLWAGEIVSGVMYTVG